MLIPSDYAPLGFVFALYTGDDGQFRPFLILIFLRVRLIYSCLPRSASFCMLFCSLFQEGSANSVRELFFALRLKQR